MRTFVKGFLALIAVTALAAGCGSSSKSSSSDSGSKSSGTTVATNKGFSIDTPEGQASISLNGNLPPNWPSSFPVPENASPAGSGSLGNSNSATLVGVYTVDGSAEDAYNFYKTNTAYTVGDSSSAGAGSAFVGKVSFSGAYKGSATVAGRNNTTYIVVVLDTGGTSGSTTSTSY